MIADASASPRPLALVTGGWKRIGAAIARTLAAEGYDLALHAHHAASFDPALDDALRAAGARVEGFEADLADPAAPAALLGAVRQQFGRAPQLLVNNASLFGDDDARSMNAATLDAHYAVNLRAPLLLTQAFAAALGPDVAGAVVQILDQRIRNPHGDQLSYTISKQALAQSVRTLARALAPHVRVNAVAPGLTLPTADYSAAQWRDLAGKMPLARLPLADEIAAAVGYLAQAGAITGQILMVDAGAHLEAYPRDFMHL